MEIMSISAIKIGVLVDGPIEPVSVGNTSSDVVAVGRVDQTMAAVVTAGAQGGLGVARERSGSGAEQGRGGGHHEPDAAHRQRLRIW
jgi:hypothetical protein